MRLLSASSETSGQLQTKAELDKETKDTYTVTVTAADSLNDSSTITVTIKVTNVDEMPKLEGDASRGLRRERHGRRSDLYGRGSGR